MNIFDEIRKLHQLHLDGAITAHEFAQAKAAILGIPVSEPRTPNDSLTSHGASDDGSDPAPQPQDSSIQVAPVSSVIPPASSADQPYQPVVRRDYSQKALVWALCGLSFSATLFVAVLILTPLGGPAPKATWRSGTTPTSATNTNPISTSVRNEREVGAQLEQHLREYAKLFCPEAARVEGPLTDNRYGKHRFRVISSSCTVTPNNDSTETPFRGVLRVRW